MTRGRTHLTCEVGDRTLAIPLSAVERVLPMLPADPLPGAPPSVQGFTTIGGRPVPLLRLRGVCGLPPVDDDTDHRIVLCVVEGRQVGLVVDDVRGLGSPAATRSPGREDGITTDGVVDVVGVLGDSVCLVIDPVAAARVLGAAEPS